MKAVKTDIGEMTVMIETMSEPIEVVGDAGPGRRTVETGLASDLRDAYTGAKEVIAKMTTDLGDQMNSLPSISAPTSFELQFGMALSTEGRFWVVSGKGDCTLKVKLTWQRDKGKEAAQDDLQKTASPG
jgi:hypothetical protein